MSKMNTTMEEATLRGAGLSFEGGPLMAIGGAEDRLDDKVILSSFAHFSGGKKARIGLAALVLHGIHMVVSAIRPGGDRRLAGLLTGTATIVIGLLCITWPVLAIQAVRYAVGAWLVVLGLRGLIDLALRRRRARRGHPDAPPQRRSRQGWIHPLASAATAAPHRTPSTRPRLHCRTNPESCSAPRPSPTASRTERTGGGSSTPPPIPRSRSPAAPSSRRRTGAQARSRC